MVDAERLARMLARVVDDLVALRAIAAREDVVADLRMSAMKYRFVTAIEGCVRAAQHVVSSEGLSLPTSNAEAVRELGRHEMVDGDVAERVATAVGFRNVLVHQYAEVDDARVVANLELLGDLDDFVDQLRSWAVRP